MITTNQFGHATFWCKMQICAISTSWFSGLLCK